MNAKKAKAIRRMLKDAIAANMEDGKQVTEVSYVEQESRRKTALVPMGLGKEPMLQVVAPGTLRVATNSVRGVYLSFKDTLSGKKRK
jgi:hypothetical protein